MTVDGFSRVKEVRKCLGKQQQQTSRRHPAGVAPLFPSKKKYIKKAIPISPFFLSQCDRHLAGSLNVQVKKYLKKFFQMGGSDYKVFFFNVFQDNLYFFFEKMKSYVSLFTPRCGVKSSRIKLPEKKIKM